MRKLAKKTRMYAESHEAVAGASYCFCYIQAGYVYYKLT